MDAVHPFVPQFATDAAATKIQALAGEISPFTLQFNRASVSPGRQAAKEKVSPCDMVDVITRLVHAQDGREYVCLVPEHSEALDMMQAMVYRLQ